jgi:hypothetical protein
LLSVVYSRRVSSSSSLDPANFRKQGLRLAWKKPWGTITVPRDKDLTCGRVKVTESGDGTGECRSAVDGQGLTSAS